MPLDKAPQLIWGNKNNHHNQVILPFTKEEIVNTYAHTFFNDPQLNLETKTNNDLTWRNKLFYGDNKFLLSSITCRLLKEEIDNAGGIKLIYIDPPFDVGSNFYIDRNAKDINDPIKSSIPRQLAYSDIWGQGNSSFISMIYERIRLARDVLDEDGIIFIHCDYRIDAYIRLLMDEVFGRNCFINQIILRRKGGAALKNMGNLSNAHDLILCYGKKQGKKLNKLYTKPSKEYINKQFRYEEKDGRRFMLNVIRSPSPRPNLKYSYKGYQTPPNGWSIPLETMQKLDSEGRLYFPESKTKQIYKKIYLDEYPGQPINTLWTDIPLLKGNNKEILSYPTQKPEALLRRIILLGSNPGDIVLDFFCGSGTTLSVAEQLERKWIGVDNGKHAIHTTKKRILNIHQLLIGKQNKRYSFEILDFSKYELEHLLEQNKETSKERTLQEYILSLYKAKHIETFNYFKGEKNGQYIVICERNNSCSKIFFEKVINEAIKNKIQSFEILAFKYDLNLLPEIIHLAQSKELRVKFKYIPKNIFYYNQTKYIEAEFPDVNFLDVDILYQEDYIQIKLKNFYCHSDYIFDINTNEIDSPSVDKDTSINHWLDYWEIDFNYEDIHIRDNIPRSKNPSRDKPSKVHFISSWQAIRDEKKQAINLLTPPIRKNKFGSKIGIKAVDILGNPTLRVIKLR